MLAIPVSVVAFLRKAATILGLEKDQAVADLAIIAFYYLLRVGEYTYTNAKENRRTVQFRAKDVTFWGHDNRVIPNTSPLDELMTAKSATLSISNQKNGTRGSLINHEANGTFTCPVSALARRVHDIMKRGSPEDILGTFFTKRGYKAKVTQAHMGKALKEAIISMNLVGKGFPVESVNTHSLRAGGAMAMHLNGVSPITIRKQGRWSSDTFLMYIHEQVSAFSAGVSAKMANDIGFHNIAGPALLENQQKPAAGAA